MTERERLFDDFFAHAPAAVDISTIRQQWLALSPAYAVDKWLLPLPLWAQRNYDHNGPQAWQILQEQLGAARPIRPFCIYIHVPFCSSKCHFCDCYSFKLGTHQERHFTRYTRQICQELCLWSQQGNVARRPISTVHLGGGTPTFPGPRYLTEIVETCRRQFNTSEQTEWALESTVESLTDEMIRTMHELGFRRLHLGVQSLQEPVRQAIKRRRPVAEVLQTIEKTLSLGWVVSVDLVCGLPHQTLAGWVNDIQQLVNAGVNGLSLYELLIYPQNRRWATAQGLTHPERHINNYFMFQAGATVLARQLYHKNLFNHWADARDDNRYFTFPTRGEDCLAIGTIGDGVFGDYHFRHLRYAPYMRSDTAVSPQLEGGLRRTRRENELLPLTTAILANTIPPKYLPFLYQKTQSGLSLLEKWHLSALITPSSQGGFSLTTNGAWFAGNMIHDMNTETSKTGG
jgi:coproporphyrinogen III oxidase-like Fe-S oxidoreductase